MFCRMCGAPVKGDAEFCSDCQSGKTAVKETPVENTETVVSEPVASDDAPYVAVNPFEKKVFNAFPMALVSMIVSVVGPTMMGLIVREFDMLKDNIGITIAMLVIGAACLACGIVAICNVSKMKKAKLGKAGVTMTLGILAVVFSSFIVMNNLQPVMDAIKEAMGSSGTIA